MSAALLRTDESALKGVRHNLVAQLDKTRKVLQYRPLSDEKIHTIRKDLKRARASLRLMREALGVTAYRRLNRAVRDAARPLTPVRDTKVLLQAFDKVVEHIGKSAQLPIVNELRLSLRQELDFNRTQLKAKDIAAIRNRLNAVKQSSQKLADTRLAQADVNAALKRAHKKARKAFKTVKDKPRDKILHEWRKQVKYELNQLELLQPRKTKGVSATIRQAHKLSDHLGDDHDLAILEERITAWYKQTVGADALLKALKPMRAKLQRAAHRLGKSLYLRDKGSLSA